MKRKKIMGAEPKGTKKNGKVFTAQMVDDILVLNFYEDGKLKTRYCMNTQNNEYLCCSADGNTWVQRRVRDVWGAGYYNTYRDAECRPGSGTDDGTVRKALGIPAEANIFSVISDREYCRNAEIRRNSEDNKRMRIERLMGKVGRLPDGFNDWVLRVSGTGVYAFTGTQENIMVCSSCTGTFPRQGKNGKKAVHNERTVCPCCKKELVVKTRTDRIRNIVHAVLLQEVDEKQGIARHFGITVSADALGTHVDECENVRIILKKQPRSGRACDIYYRGYRDEWWTSNPCNRRINSEFLYPSGIRESLGDTAYEPWVNAFTALAGAGVKLMYNNLMAACPGKKLPDVIEYLFKGRFYSLVRETAEHIWTKTGSYFGPLDLYGQNTAEIFGIGDIQKINRIRDMDGGNKMVEWMKLSDKYGVKMSDETLKWFVSSRIAEKEILFIIGKMSPQQIMNYVKKQQATEYPALDEKKVLSQWADYMGMCMAVGRDISDEMVYRPRQLRRRHDELVGEINKRRILEDMDRDAEKRRKAARELGERFPGAEKALRDVAEKFTYENSRFRIIVPETLFDIVTEGQALHHCVGSADRYFDRIMQHETYICFLRRVSEPEVPFYTIEVEPGGTVRQHRSYLDEEPGIEEIRGFLREWQQEVKKRMDDRDREHAGISKRKREENIEELKRQNNTRVLRGLQEDFMEAI